MSEHSAAEWTTAVKRALDAHDVKAVPHLLVLMSLDGHAHEAETIRRSLLRTASAARARISEETP